MGPLDFKLELPMQWNGPIELPERATDGIEWAHHILKRNCRYNRMGPLDFRKELPMQ